jgi:WD40 repeat protein
LASAEWFDLTTGSFTRTKGNMVQGREGHCAVLLPNGTILIAGGETSTSALKTAEIFDPLTDTFSPIEEMTSARWAFTATLLQNGKVLIAGGYDNTNAQANAELFDPATNSFTRIQNMTSARMHHTATLLASGKVLLTGGWSSESPITVLATAELFDPFTNTFTATGSMSAVRAMHSASLLANDKVLILGGASPMFSVASAELYGPASGTFTDAGLLNGKRHLHTATLLPSGSLLVAGGIHEFSGPDAPEFEHLSSAELFDPASGNSIFTGSLETGRVGHTATLLNDGRVLVIGGNDGNGNALATAELYK